MQRVTSTDGTEIAVERNGDGPPLVCVHGTGTTRQTWYGMAPELGDGYTIVLPERRGRGKSGDADEYDLDREVEDLLAVVDSCEGTPSLFGHSFGALVALTASRTTGLDLDRLVCYEPPIVVGEYREHDSLADEMARLLAAGNREGAVKLFFAETVGAEDVERWPIWPDCVDLAETFVRESRVVEHYRLPERLDLDVPTLLLVGTESPPYLRSASRVLTDRLPDARLVELDGLDHNAVVTAPGTVAAEVRSFLESGSTIG